MTIAEQILEYLQQNGPVSTKQLASALGVPSRTIAHNLSILITNGQVFKLGKQPNIVYGLGPGQVVPPAPTPEVFFLNPPQAPPLAGQEVKTAKAAPSQIQPLGQELLPNWCQKFNIDPTVVTTRYEAVRGFVPGLSPRSKSSAKKKFLAALYSGIVLALVFLSVWVQKTGRWSPILKIVGLILILGLIYVVVFPHHRSIPHQNPTYGSTRYEGESNQLEAQLIASQEENSKLKDQLADSQSQLSQLKEQLISNQDELSKTKERLSNSQDATNRSAQYESELARTKEQLTQEQQERKNLEGQIQTLQEENQHLSKTLRPDSEQAPYNESTGQVTISQVIDWTKQGLPPDVIIKSIKDSRSHYTLTPEDIYYLKKQGVSDSVIEAMSAPRQGIVQKVKGFITNMGGL